MLGDTAASGDGVDPEEGTGLRIMLVDDEDTVREIAVDLLREAGHEPDGYASGAEALAALTAGVPADVLLADVLMPGMDGTELVRQARALRPDLPVVFLTGNAEPDPDRPLDAPVLAKPYRLAELLRAVRAAAASGRAA